ncbi:MAG: hypothetical protein NTU85_02250 [Candidatus Kaiserbacteria bacterium]|nr:hypothetical protein [Candidatus Kaiserbacteria bacterium]
MTKAKESVHIPRLVRRSMNGVMQFDAFSNLYTEPRIALWELNQRRKDNALKKAVRENLGSSAENFLKKFNQPRAVLFRQVATPTHEIIRFLKIANKMNLKPLILEYHDDKFVSAENRFKRSLGKMPIYQYTGSDGREMVEYETICNFNTSTGKKFKNIICLNGEKLIPFHHRLFRTLTGLNPKTYTVDGSDWFSSAGKKAELYYEQFLSFFIRDGILFENFMPFRSEGAFTKTIISPAFENLEKKYGVKPLIVRLAPEKEEMRQFWDAYPKKIKKHLKIV